MLLFAEGDTPPLHQAYLADPALLAELGRALTALRSRREVSTIDALFRRRAREHREREQEIVLELTLEDWQAGWLEVRDLLRSQMARLSVPRRSGRACVRKLGWIGLERELKRTRALLRANAPESVLDDQRARVLSAFLASGWDEGARPKSPAPALDLDFWTAPVTEEPNERGEIEISVAGLSPRESAQAAWAQAQALLEAAIEICLPPLADPLGLGALGTLDPVGTPLWDPAESAHRGWVEPTWLPRYAAGRDAIGIEAHVRPREGVPERDLERSARRLKDAAERASAEGSALVWWDDPL